MDVVSERWEAADVVHATHHSLCCAEVLDATRNDTKDWSLLVVRGWGRPSWIRSSGFFGWAGQLDEA